MEIGTIIAVVLCVVLIIGVVGIIKAANKEDDAETPTLNETLEVSENTLDANVATKTSPTAADITIDYTGSGVKTLSGFGTFFIAFCFISLFAAFVCVINENWIVAISFVVGALSCLATGGICKGLSTIAKASLYSIHIAKKEYKIQDSQ